MLYVCDRTVFLQAALGNGKLHGIPQGDILVRRPCAAGHLAASLKKDFAARSKDRGSSGKPQGGCSFQSKACSGERWCFWVRCASAQGMNCSKSPRPNLGQWRSQGHKRVLILGLMSSFLLKTLPKQYFYLLPREHSHTIFCIKSQNEVIVSLGDTLVSCSVRQSLPDQQIIRQLWNIIHLTASFKVFLCNPKMCFVWHVYIFRCIWAH